MSQFDSMPVHRIVQDDVALSGQLKVLMLKLASFPRSIAPLQILVRVEIIIHYII